MPEITDREPPPRPRSYEFSSIARGRCGEYVCDGEDQIRSLMASAHQYARRHGWEIQVGKIEDREDGTTLYGVWRLR